MVDISKNTDKNTDSEEISSPECTAIVFGWAAAILINGSFIALIAWGTFSNWPLGFAFSILYFLVLLTVPYFLKRRNGGRDSLLTSLLFLFAIVAIAVVGSYLPLNVFPCSEGGFNNDDSYSRTDWVIPETENIPTNIRNWYENGYLYDTFSSNAISFAHFNSTDVTLFSGADGSNSGQKLLRKADGKAPEVVSDVRNPQSFISVEETSTICFFYTDDLQEDGSWQERVACTNDGVEIISTEETFNNPYQLFYSNNYIWFLSYPPPESEIWGSQLYSADPFNLNEVKLISSIASGEENDEASGDNECTQDRTNRIRFMSLLFLSGFPSFATVFGIAYLYKIPSMSVGGYLSITWCVVCLIFTIDPSFDNMDDFFRWWSVFTSGPWMIILTLAHLTNRMTKRGITWGMIFAGTFYTIGMFALLKIFSEDVFWRWALLTILTILPLFLFSIITGQIMLMVLSAIVLLIDVYRLTNFITDSVGFGESVPVQFIVLGISGLALGFLGYLLSKKQSQFQTKISAWAESALGNWVVSNLEVSSEIEEDDKYDEEDGGSA